MRALLGVALVATGACTASPPPASPPATIPAQAASPATVPPRSAEPTAGAPAPLVLSGAATVEAGDHFYSPPQLTVTVGTIVTWRIVGQSAHDITARDRSFASSAIGFGSTFGYTFTKAGRYPYYCTIHEGDGMFGDVTVVVAP